MTGIVRFVSDSISGIMQPSLTGKQLDVGASRRQRETHPMTSATFAATSFHGAPAGTMLFSRRARSLDAALSGPASRGIHFRASNEAERPAPAFGMAAQHAATQSSGHKPGQGGRRMKNRPQQA